MDGVIEVAADYDNHTATVTFDEDRTDLAAMKKALEKEEYPVSAEKLLN